MLLTQARSVVLEAQRRVDRTAESTRALYARMPRRRNGAITTWLDSGIVFGQDFLALPWMIAARRN
ncbi:MAG: hypothetical protein MRJ92_10940 [Nitrospira sp.]|nr:hypothetical protein [Nitrospira sp.]